MTLPATRRTAGITAIGVSAALLTGMLAARAQFADTTFDCVQYQTKLARAVTIYAEDYDEHLPARYATAQQLQQDTYPYLRSTAYYHCPDTGAAYVPAVGIAGDSLSQLNLEQTVLLSDATVHHNGLRTVAYADIHVLHGGKFTDTTTVCIAASGAVALSDNIYAQDWDETYPTYRTVSQFGAAVRPYIKSSWKLACPETLAPYVPSYSLSGRRVSSVTVPESTLAVSDARPHPDGDTTYAYLDGHAVHGTLGSGVSSPDQSCLTKVKQISLSLQLYTQDYDGLYPPMQSAQVLQPRLQPYLKQPGLQPYTCPVTLTLYKTNGALSGQSQSSIANPANTVTLQDATLHPNMRSTYAYADGHVIQK